MKFFSTSQIRELDKFTIEHEPIASIDLMERAAQTIYLEILRLVEADQPVLVFAGPGNNGGDALALARMLLQSTLEVQVILLHTGKLSTDCEINRQRLSEKFPQTLTEQTDSFEAPNVSTNTIIIDGLFGSGLTRPLTGIYAAAATWMNSSDCKVFSIDIPSGLHGEETSDLAVPIVKAHITFSLQFPKLAFLLPENAEFVGKWQILDIGIHPEAIKSTPGNFFYLEASDIAPILKQRSKFSHKGTFGHALIVAGSKGMSGASVLASKAALRSGAGLVTVHGPECNRLIVQSAMSEIIFSSDIEPDYITRFPATESYSSIAVGPGIGTKLKTGDALKQFIKTTQQPCILDADALNIISHYKEINFFIPKNSILTPHPKEFDRLFGVSQNTFMSASQKHPQWLKKWK